MLRRLITAMRINFGEGIIIMLILGLAATGYFNATSRNDAQESTISEIIKQISQAKSDIVRSDEKTKQQMEALDQQIAELHRIVTVGWKP